MAILSIGIMMLAAAGIWAANAVQAETTNTSAEQASTTTSAPGGRHGKNLDEMATLLGLTTAQLQTELNGGKEFYQIAAEHGVTYDKLQANRTERHKARLDDMVKVGFLTQAQADTMLKNYQDQAATMPMMGMGMGGGFGGHGPGPR